MEGTSIQRPNIPSPSYFRNLPWELACKTLNFLGIEDLLRISVDPRYQQIFGLCSTSGMARWAKPWTIVPWNIVQRTGYASYFGIPIVEFVEEKSLVGASSKLVHMFAPMSKVGVILSTERITAFKEFISGVVGERQRIGATTEYILLLRRGGSRTEYIGDISSGVDGWTNLLLDRNKPMFVLSWDDPIVPRDVSLGSRREPRQIHHEGQERTKTNLVAGFQSYGPNVVSFQSKNSFIVHPLTYWFFYEAELGLVDPTKPPSPTNPRLKDRLQIFDATTTTTPAVMDLIRIANSIMRAGRTSFGGTTFCGAKHGLSEARGHQGPNATLFVKWFWDKYYASIQDTIEENVAEEGVGVVMEDLPIDNMEEVYREGKEAGMSLFETFMAYLYNPTYIPRRFAVEDIDEALLVVPPDSSRYDAKAYEEAAASDEALAAIATVGYSSDLFYLEDGTVVRREPSELP